MTEDANPDAALGAPSGAAGTEVTVVQRTLGLLREAGTVSLAAAVDLKGLGQAVAAYSDGCMTPVAASLAALVALGASLTTFAAGTAEDATGVGAVLGVPMQAASLVGIVASLSALTASVMAAVACKQAQAQAAEDALQAAVAAMQAETDRLRDEGETDLDRLMRHLIAEQAQQRQIARERRDNVELIEAKKVAVDAHMAALRHIGAKVAGLA